MSLLVILSTYAMEDGQTATSVPHHHILLHCRTGGSGLKKGGGAGCVQWSFALSTRDSCVESQLCPAHAQYGTGVTYGEDWTLCINGCPDVVVFCMLHLGKHQTTIAIRRPGLLPNHRVVVEVACRVGVETGWFGEASHARFATRLQTVKWSWANCDCTCVCVYLPRCLG